MEHPFTWYSALHPFLPYPLNLLSEPSFTALLVMALLIGLAYRFLRSVRRASDPAVPEEQLSTRNVLELLVEIVVGLSDSIIGKEGRKYVSLFGSLFIFILLANFLGLVPGFAPPTSYFYSNLGLGLVVFCAYHYFGVREHGLHYFKQFMGPMLLLAPLFIVIELASHVFRPISLSIRLFGNMFGDHLVLEIFTDLTKVVIPVLFYILGSLVSLIQAAVFTILSVIYVAMAISHEH
ncbi:MAG: ATP synthase F0 subunit A [Deltaproteobacteria bacterium RIFCSPHIGHO2_02_FULL_60_17]|nr:MAG: ATP synthase F0 subunit A [Deltaproteobacteria bacterium RIFCSPHIGHO2_02_FULL_60_17]